MADIKTNIADMGYKELTAQQNSNTIYIQGGGEHAGDQADP